MERHDYPHKNFIDVNFFQSFLRPSVILPKFVSFLLLYCWSHLFPGGRPHKMTKKEKRRDAYSTRNQVHVLFYSWRKGAISFCWKKNKSDWSVSGNSSTSVGAYCLAMERVGPVEVVVVVVGISTLLVALCDSSVLWLLPVLFSPSSFDSNSLRPLLPDKSAFHLCLFNTQGDRPRNFPRPLLIYIN